MINVGEIVTDPDFVQSFVVYRSTGAFVDGVWTENEPTQITMNGVVSVASARELNQVPEGDRIRGGMIFHTVEEIFVTRTGTTPGISDKILWRGDLYKLVNVSPYVDYGYFKAVGERIKGS